MTRVTWAAVSCALVVVTAAFGLKLLYSHAGASELLWVLGPSCALARLGGIELAYEAGAGFISHRSHMVVGAACAGVNFLVMSWLALYFAAQARFAQLRSKLGWCGASLLGAFVATIATNALRIVLAAQLYELPLYGGWLTPTRLHRLLGIVLYCGALVVLCSLAEHWVGTARRVRLAPLYWYLGIAVGLPLLKRAFVPSAGHSGRFSEHALVTFGAAIGVIVVCRLFAWLLPRVVWLSWRLVGERER
ncbi:MAG: hypothetical protein RL701_3433 [Pseudomonadota bacterium]